MRAPYFRMGNRILLTPSWRAGSGRPVLPVCDSDPVRTESLGVCGRAVDIGREPPFLRCPFYNLQPPNLAIAIPAVSARLQRVFRRLGLAALPEVIAAECVETGRLKAIMTDWDLPAVGIFVVRPASQHTPRKIRVLIDMLAETFSSDRA